MNVAAPIRCGVMVRTRERPEGRPCRALHAAQEHCCAHGDHSIEEHDQALADAASEDRLAGKVAAVLAARATEATTRTASVLLEADEAAALIGITVEALYQRKSRHQLPSGCVVKTGVRRFQFHRAKLLEGLERKAKR